MAGLVNLDPFDRNADSEGYVRISYMRTGFISLKLLVDIKRLAKGRTA